MKTSYRSLFFCFVLLLTTVACSKDDNESTNPKSNSKRMLEFKFEATRNSSVLTQDLIGTIKGSQILLSVPEGTNRKRLTATFLHNGVAAYIDEVEQQSGSTINDFSRPTTYTIEAEDGSLSDYALVWDEFEDTGKTFVSFSFAKENNPGLFADTPCPIAENTITVTLWARQRTLVASFETSASEVTVDGVKQISGETPNDFSKPVTYVVKSKTGGEKQYTVSVTWESQIPHVYIETENSQPILSKTDYVNANLTIHGKDRYEDYVGTTQIRGRGNSTWGMPKKPYRLKLEKKAGLLGLGKGKSWVLLANYIDPTLMLNAVAMKTGQLLGLPFTNHIIPVDVTLNGEYVGNYMFTEKIGISSISVDIDETDGVLLELDENFDEDYKFRSAHYHLPVMVKDPDIRSDEHFQKIKNEFQAFEDLVASHAFPNNDYLQQIDAEALVDYLIVFNLTHNMEINHPKSVYLYKEPNGKYTMGPIWDFDWAYGYENGGVHFASYTTPVFGNIGNAYGRRFFERFLEDPEIQTLYRERWNTFKTHLPELYTYIDEYAAAIYDSQAMNFKIWPANNRKFEERVGDLKQWLKGRVEYIDRYVADLR